MKPLAIDLIHTKTPKQRLHSLSFQSILAIWHSKNNNYKIRAAIGSTKNKYCQRKQPIRVRKWIRQPSQ